MATEGKSFRPSTRKNWETVWRCHIDADLGGWHMSVSARMCAGVQIAASESQGGSVTAGGCSELRNGCPSTASANAWIGLDPHLGEAFRMAPWTKPEIDY